MPVSGEFKGHLGPEVYGSKYSHEKEVVKPGYHSVVLDSYGIKAELTATTRVGMHRYSFPANMNKYVLLDLGTKLGPSGTKEDYAGKINNKKIEGYALMDATRRRPKPTFVYFVILFDSPFKSLHA